MPGSGSSQGDRGRGRGQGAAAQPDDAQQLDLPSGPRERAGHVQVRRLQRGADNVGTEMTVGCASSAPTMTPEEIRDSSTWVEGVNTFVVANVTETFGGNVLMIPAAVPPKEWPMLACTGTASADRRFPPGHAPGERGVRRAEAPVAFRFHWPGRDAVHRDQAVRCGVESDGPYRIDELTLTWIILSMSARPQEAGLLLHVQVRGQRNAPRR